MAPVNAFNANTSTALGTCIGNPLPVVDVKSPFLVAMEPMNGDAGNEVSRSRADRSLSVRINSENYRQGAPCAYASASTDAWGSSSAGTASSERDSGRNCRTRTPTAVMSIATATPPNPSKNSGSEGL